MDKGATCSADRFPSWAKHGFVQDEDEEGIVERAEYLLRGIGGETKEDLTDSRTAKMGLPEGALEVQECQDTCNLYAIDMQIIADL